MTRVVDPTCRWDGCLNLKTPGRGRKWCDEHRVISARAAEERRRPQGIEGQRRRRKLARPKCAHPGCDLDRASGRGSKLCAEHRVSHAEAKRIAKNSAPSRTYRPKAPRLKLLREESERSKRRVMVTKVPANIRNAWRNADPNSIIRRKYPTKAALESAYTQEAA